VTALIAFTNRGGEQRLRKLEQLFLDAGIIVASTSEDLTRYRGRSTGRKQTRLSSAPRTLGRPSRSNS
jgi:hypothetical protein